jgi:hypothetical protein
MKDNHDELYNQKKCTKRKFQLSNIKRVHWTIKFLFTFFQISCILIEGKHFSLKTKKVLTKLGVVVHTCNPSTQDAEAGGSQVPGQATLRRMTVSKQQPSKINK